MNFASKGECQDAGMDIIREIASHNEVDASQITEDTRLDDIVVDQKEAIMDAEEKLGVDLDAEKDALQKNGISITVGEFQQLLLKKFFEDPATA